MSFATRALSKTARGGQRRISRGKRSSLHETIESSNDADKYTNRRTSTSELLKESRSSSATLITSLPGADDFFRAQKVGSKGMRNKRKRNTIVDDELKITLDEFRDFIREGSKYDPSTKYFAALMDRNIALLKRSMWLTMTKGNILIFGLGSKEKLLKEAVRMLDGEDVIEVSGSEILESQVGLTVTGDPNGEECIRSLITIICQEILNIPDISSHFSSITNVFWTITDYLDKHYGGISQNRLSEHEVGSTLGTSSAGETASNEDFHSPPVQAKRRRKALSDDQQAMLRWGGRYVHCQHKLYIVVKDICGTALRSRESQLCLSILASCKSVVLVATLEMLDVAINWDKLLLSRFQWHYFHLPCFEHSSVIDKDFPFIRNDANISFDDQNDEIAHLSQTTNGTIQGNSTSLMQIHKSLYGSGIAAILKSMTKIHIDVLKKMCSMVIAQKQNTEIDAKLVDKTRTKGDQRKSILIISKNELFKIAKKSWTVKEMSTLTSVLKEFVDHNFIKIGTSRSLDDIQVLLKETTIEKLAENL